MAALSANAAIPPRRDPGSTKFEAHYKATGADEYYVGSVTCAASGKAILTNADAAKTLGFCMQRTTITAADQPVKVHVAGIWWVSAVAFADATGPTAILFPLAASDNPADLTASGATNPDALGMILHIDVTGASGWIDLGQRVIPATA